MKKTAVISSTKHDTYLFYVPIVTWMWKKFGWEVCCFFCDDKSESILSKFNSLKCNIIPNTAILDTCHSVDKEAFKSIRSETVMQCVRLYAANLFYTFNNCDFIMTSDADMLPLSNYWHFDETKIITWGRDLTDYHFPMCYIGMSPEKWTEVMGLTGNTVDDMNKDFNNYPKSRSNNWEEWWQVDQDIITERLQNRSDVVRVNRGTQPNGYPLGRIDRGCWETSLLQPERIDSHLPREGYKEENFTKILSLIQSIFPSENLQWMRDYRDEYVNLMEFKN